MKLLCHRGMWFEPGEKNSLQALTRAISKGFGIETDVRDLDGELVISHDPPTKRGALTLATFLDAYRQEGRAPLLALNVKSDGLHAPLQEMLRQFGIANYFVFDMSVPDTLGYVGRGMPCAARLSEYELQNSLLSRAETIWLDAFDSEWYGTRELTAWLASGKRVCVVSSELHRRPHAGLWDSLRAVSPDLQENLHLCTDLFSLAEEAFQLVEG